MASETEESLDGMVCPEKASSILDTVSPASTNGPRLALQEVLQSATRKKDRERLREGGKLIPLFWAVVGEVVARRHRVGGWISSSLKTLILEL